MHAVELKAGPRFALFCVNNWSEFLFFCVFLKISFSLQKEDDFSKSKAPPPPKKNDPKVVLKTGPILLRNILGPILTQPWTNF